jgi:hypothetical protein
MTSINASSPFATRFVTAQPAQPRMDMANATRIINDNFKAIEGVGVNAKGAGAGDGNIGRRELERVADPNSGFSPDVRAAAKFMLDHPTAARSVDQGAGKAKGDPNEYHFSQADLQSTLASLPSSSASGTGALPGSNSFGSPVGNVSDTLNALGSLLNTLNTLNALSSDAFSTPAQAPFQFAPPLPSFGSDFGSVGAPSQQPMDVYSAAQTLKDHFKFAEGVGMNAAGKGAGDGNIGMSELKRLADPNSGAPEPLRQAADFLINHPTALRSVDQGAGKARGDANEVHINLQDLEALTASAPKSQGSVSGLNGLAQLAGRPLFIGC